VLVVGGGRETPGAAVLAGLAALRAGAGKLQIATGEANAPLVAAAIPEARVFALPETKAGKPTKAAVELLAEHAGRAQAVCVGPGMIENEAVARFVSQVLGLCREVPVVLDAGAIACLCEGRELLSELNGRAVVTPNAEEMANIWSVPKEEVTRDAASSALRAAREYGAVFALKGRETFIASAEGECLVNRAGSVGLATSGSGDVLAGVIAGFVARGAAPLRGAAWGVYVHALAGERLSQRVGTLGFLARELSAEIPRLLDELGGEREEDAENDENGGGDPGAKRRQGRGGEAGRRRS
jgi:ADP-dependent NAD(P)H-hydrate dehydratase